MQQVYTFESVVIICRVSKEHIHVKFLSQKFLVYFYRLIMRSWFENVSDVHSEENRPKLWSPTSVCLFMISKPYGGERKKEACCENMQYLDYPL